MNLNTLANKLFDLSRNCPKEYESPLLEAVAVIYKMEKEDKTFIKDHFQFIKIGN
jgi:hypothetical protein